LYVCYFAYFVILTSVTNGQTDDRQTDHAAEKRVGAGGIACAARAILPNNDN